MAIIRPNDLPDDAAPNPSDVVPIDGASVRKTSLAALVNSGRPLASQSEAEVGTDPDKTMTPLTTKQSISSEVGSTVQSFITASPGATGADLVGSAAPDDAGGVIGQISTRAAAVARSINAALDYIQTAGYDATGDNGGALYKRVAVEPTHAGKFQSVDGAWWELADRRPNPRMFGAKEDGTDASAAIQAFFDYISTVDVGIADVAGFYSIASGLTLGPAPAMGGIATRLLVGDLNLTALNPIPVMLRTQSAPNLVHDGRINITGTGGADYSNQGCEVGFQLDGSPRARFGGFQLNSFKFAAIHVTSAGTNSNFTEFGLCRINNCGSGNVNFGETANWSNQVDAGSQGSIAQTSTIDVDVNLPTFVDSYATVDNAQLMVNINDELYYITAVDRTLGTITVHPWIDNTLGGSGTLTYVFGGGVYLHGSNANGMAFGVLDCLRCAIGLGAGSLYAPVVKMLGAQACGIGWAIGDNRASSALGGICMDAYFEGPGKDIVYVTQSGGSSHQVLAAEYELHLDRCFSVTTPRNNSNVRSRIQGVFTNFGMNFNGVDYTHEKFPGNLTGSTLGLSLAQAHRKLVYLRDSWTVNIRDDANTPEFNRLFGYDSVELTMLGTGSANQPTGTITFNPPAGATVNGGASAVFSGLTRIPNFLVQWRVDANDYVVVNTAVQSEADIGALTDSSGGAVDGTIAAIVGTGADTDINNNFADLSDKVNDIRTALQNLGLMS